MKTLRSVGRIDLFGCPRDIVEIKFDGFDAHVLFELGDENIERLFFKSVESISIKNESLFHFKYKLDVGYSEGWMYEFEKISSIASIRQNRAIIFWAGDYVVLISALDIVHEGHPYFHMR